LIDDEEVASWLRLLLREVRIIILKINDRDFDNLFGTLREIYELPVPVTTVTSEVKNLLASLALTDGRMIARRAYMQNAVVSRLMEVRYRILQEKI
jgi:hypothetical protein